MKGLFFLGCGWIVILVGMASAAPPEKENPSREIAKVLDDQAAAWNKADLEGFMAGYVKSDDLSFYSGNAKTKGWQATLDRYRKKYQGEGKEMGKLTFSEQTIEILGSEHALVKGRFTLKLAKESPTGIYTLVMKKLPEGWKIIHDHTSN